jgi:murein DD-endopeptidase MepM/ murein hydrolase activator NlpD
MRGSRPLFRRPALVCLGAATLAISACEGDPAGLRALPGVTITVKPDALTLTVGASTPLAATVQNLNGDTLTGREIQWSSSAPEIVEVSPTGVVTAIAIGVAMVGAYSDQGVGFTRVVVQMDFRLPVPASRSILRSETGSPTGLCPGGEGGLRDDGGRECSHAGISRYSLDFRSDSSLSVGAGVGAAADGTVMDVCRQPPTEATCGLNGPFVYIEHASGFATFYSHLDPGSISVRRKTKVAVGDALGRMGTWGAESYPWVHFEVRYNNQDPGPNPILDGLLVDGRKLTDYRVGQ